MSAEILAGKPASQAIRANVSRRAAALREAGVVPTLRLVRVGQRDDDVAYQRSIERQASKVGVEVSVTELRADVTQHALDAAVLEANHDHHSHGIMVFQPLPDHLVAEAVNKVIAPVKDVDGLTPVNQAKLYRGDPDAIPPCTPAGVVALLEHHGVPLKGARVAIVGRSLVVGKPAAMLLLGKHATVTVCHSRTVDLPTVTREADIVVAALGKAKFLTAEYFRAGQTVVDVGIHVDDDGSLVGDVDADAVAEVVARIAPAKGGVGSVTSALLFDHVVTAAERVSGLKPSSDKEK